MNLKHILIIPDGNRRWAKNKNLNSWEGHKAGAENTQNLFEHVVRSHPEIKHCTFWAMSKDNFMKRSKKEIGFLIKLIGEEMQKFADTPLIKKNKVNIKFYGEYDKLFDKKTVNDLRNIEKETENYTNFYVSILLAYNGKEEILNAIRSLKNAKNVTENMIKQHLWTKNLPMVDLIIRTGVEDDPHLSGNVLMWQTDYAQLYFTKTFYPDFDTKEFETAIEDYRRRMRRKGK